MPCSREGENPGEGAGVRLAALRSRSVWQPFATRGQQGLGRWGCVRGCGRRGTADTGGVEVLAPELCASGCGQASERTWRV